MPAINNLSIKYSIILNNLNNPKKMKKLLFVSALVLSFASFAQTDTTMKKMNHDKMMNHDQMDMSKPMVA